MKASILKKLNIIIEAANAYKDKNDFNNAIKKFHEAIEFINEKVAEEEDKNTEIENIENAINQTYSVQVDSIIQGAIRFTAQKKYDEAKKEFQRGLEIVEIISDPFLKEAEKEDINKLISENEIEQLFTNGLELKNQNKPNDALEMFRKALDIGENTYDSEFRSEALSRIKNEISIIYDSKIDEIIEKGKEFEKIDKIDDAIEAFEEALETIENYFEVDVKKTQINTIKNLLNEIYSNQIKPLIDNGNESLKQNLVEQAISQLNNAYLIAKKMYDSDLKNVKMSLIAEILNPLYIERITPIMEKGKILTQQEKFEESVISINKAVDNFQQAFDLIKLMVSSDKKEKLIKEISDFINNVCVSGINVIKDKSIQYIVQKKYDDAVSDLYVALSLAKRMTYPEEDNPELNNLKKLVNKVYSAEVAEVVNEGRRLVKQGKFEEAIKVFNDALTMTNKMYLTDEMEKEVGMIKSLIYETEIKQLVGKGELVEEQKIKEKEIEKLKKRLDYAQSIDDSDRRVAEMNKIKKLIDEVHSDEIRLLVEQGNQLAELKKFIEAFEFYEKGLKVTEMMEFPDVKNKDLIKMSFKNQLINRAKIEIDNLNYDTAIESCKRALELDEMFVEAYYQMGEAFTKKKKFDIAIQNYQRAVDFNKNHYKSLKSMGLAYELKKDYDTALINLNKSVEINPNFSEGWYNLGNVHKLRREFDNAIECYKKATEIEPELANAWLFMGNAYFDKKDYYNAIENIEKAIKINPDLGKDLNPLIKDFKNMIENLQKSLSLFFINK
ncbi:MAG: tetratricopeptide repeat protein [Candidatus Thorarchaeota archaeon]